MTRVPMRKLHAPSASATSLLRATLNPQPWRFPLLASLAASSRQLAQVRPEPLHELWFTPNNPRRAPNGTEPNSLLPNQPGPGQNNDQPPPSERTLALGRTLRTLSPLLPDILTQPLPQAILSPSVTLHLFPSTHPHLPVVKGKTPYRAALFTAPVAWGAVPFMGNTKLQIVSEKMVRTGYDACTPNNDAGEEKLVIRWQTAAAEGNSSTSKSIPSGARSASTSTNPNLTTLLGGANAAFSKNGKPFSGLFIFTFDSAGRIASHTIEHADEDSGYDRTSKVVTLTDWLLGKAKGRKAEEGDLIPGLGVAMGHGGRGSLLAQVVRLAREERRRGRERLW